MDSVKVGDREIPIEEPSIYKTELIGEKIASIGNEIPDLQIAMGEFVTQYEASNIIEMDRATAEYQRPERAKEISEEAWKAGNNKLRLPRSPSGNELLMAMAPIAFQKAKDKVLDVAAILIAPNSELEDESKIKEVLAAQRKFLRHKAKPSQLIPLVAETHELMREVIEANKEQVGKIRAFWTGVFKPADQPDTEHEAALQEAEDLVPGTVHGETGDSDSPTSSPPTTDGDTSSADIESPSETLSGLPS